MILSQILADNPTPGRALDAEIVLAMGWRQIETGTWQRPLSLPPYWQAQIRGLPSWSTSLDAAVGLAEEKLPGWKLCLWIGFDENSAEVIGDTIGQYAREKSPSICIATLLALAVALEQGA
jgi:hypothetical protein